MTKPYRIAPLLAVALLAACDRGPTSPLLQTSVAGLFTEGVFLEVGEVLTLTAGEAQAVFLEAGEEGAEYLYVPFNATDDVEANLRVEVIGGNIQPPTGPPNPSRGPLASLVPGAAGPLPDADFHEALRAREIRELTPLFRAGRQAAGGPAAQRAAAAAIPPTVGEVVTINASLNACAEPNPRQARVVAVSDRAIVVEDLANPAGGFSGEEYQRVAMTFDTLIYPVDVTYFGVPTDIDNNNRVVIFYTRVVNELTPANSDSYTGGFFFSRDLFPRVETDGLGACPTSNVAEIFYLLAPDPTGAVNGNVRSKDFVLRATLGTIAHEFQHLINASRRIYINNANDYEDVWLNEGLSHIAEELMFYAVTPLEPRQNITLEMLRASPQILQAVNTWQVSNLVRFLQYLENPDEESLLGEDELPTRGASWAFLRYAADQEPGPDVNFFYRLANGVESGVENLNSVLSVDAIDLMQTWTVSVYTDDAVPAVPPLYVQPSWNFRSVMPVLADTDQYPLDVRRLGADTEAAYTLKGGGAAFVRFGVPAGGQAVLTTTSGGAIPPDRLRISVVRVR